MNKEEISYIVTSVLLIISLSSIDKIGINLGIFFTCLTIGSEASFIIYLANREIHNTKDKSKLKMIKDYLSTFKDRLKDSHLTNSSNQKFKLSKLFLSVISNTNKIPLEPL